MENKLKKCPFCGKDAVTIGVFDRKGEYFGEPGCEYEANPCDGIYYGLCHQNFGECIIAAGDTYHHAMGGVLFGTAEKAANAWNSGIEHAAKLAAND